MTVPLITRIFLRSGLLFFMGSLVLGIALQVEALGFPGLVPLFWHTLMVGWITQIIMGVSLWMFPGRNKVESFSNQKWAWLAYIFLESGLILRIISEPLVLVSVSSAWKVILIVSAFFQFFAVMSYVIEIWPRVISKDKLVRKKFKGK